MSALDAVVERPMTPEDISAGLELCRAAGWNQVRTDWELYLAQNPAGCSVLVCQGRVAGTVITLDYQGHFGWVGMVLVRPELRGEGLGTRLLHIAFRHLRTCETVKLDATPAGRRIYLPLGFMDEYGVLRMETASAGAQYPTLRHTVRPMAETDLPAVAELDAPVFGARRDSVLATYRHAAPDMAFVAGQGGRITGYILGRRGHSHHHAGAIVAPDAAMARDLLIAVLAAHPGQPFLLDALPHNPGWPAWLREIGFREQRPYTRMYKGTNRFPGLPRNQFAILGPELG